MISIIAILASMLLVGVGLVRASAHETACRNQLGQLTLAAAGWSNENEGYLPGFIWNDDFYWTASLTSSIDTQWNWNDPITNKLVKAYRCPNDGGANSPYIHPDAASNGYYVSYGIWQMTSRPAGDAWAHWGR